MDVNVPQRRLTIAVDAEGYSSRSFDGMKEVQRGLREVLDHVDEHGDLDRVDWDRQPQGDGEVAVLPPGTIEATAISNFIRGLSTALHHYNKSRNKEYRLRLRIAIDQGNIAVGEFGFIGNAVNAVCRMRDSDALRAALTSHPGAPFVVAVSDSIYSDVVVHGQEDLYRFTFNRHQLANKDFQTTAWVHVSDDSTTRAGHRAPDDTSDHTAPSPQRSVVQHSGTGNAYGGDHHGDTTFTTHG
ncbi:hypothetical protein [Nocardiopsis dassonvillei]|uniref:hypothetical protein n=1 Tax=Nocardiopsis dassonvillei TaxID=2014 RepID=UPI00157CD0EE|nr:hypothetical protein [Nocardiopsis dassonvillei]